MARHSTAAAMVRALALLCSSGLWLTAAAAEMQSIELLTPPFPCLSMTEPTATLAEAYRAQQARNQLREAQDPVVGFKAGLTTVALQQRFRSAQPVFGVLFQRGERSATAGIRLSEFGTAKLETEVGFVVAEAITAPLRDVSELRRYFREVVPAIEVPELSFVAGCSPNAMDLIAANVGAAQHLRGAPKPWASLPDLNALTVSMQRDGTVLATSTSHAVQPSIEASLLYLVNEALAQGHVIQPGQLFITGALSGLIDAKPGQHLADFGVLGQIRFTVQP